MPELGMQVIMAIDPGGTTGIATKSSLDGYHTCTVRSDEELWGFFESPPSLVIVENFMAETISKYGLATVRLVGGVQALCWSKNIPLVIQPPQKRRAFLEASKKLIKTLGYQYVIHEVDALAHLLAYEYWDSKGKTEFHYGVLEDGIHEAAN